MTIKIHHGLCKCGTCPNKFWLRDLTEEQVALLKGTRIQCGQCYSFMHNEIIEIVTKEQ